MASLGVVAPARARFSCLEGCGFCCTTSPGLDPAEVPPSSAHPLAHLLASRPDGSTGIRLNASASTCAALDATTRRCTTYAVRPRACHAFPVHVHAGERLQATVNMVCPGISTTARDGDVDVEALASDALEAARAGAGEDAIAAARENWREFRNRLQALEEPDPGLVRRAIEPLLSRFGDPHAVSALYLALADGRATTNTLPAALAEAEALGERPILARDVFPELAQEAWPASDESLPVLVDLTPPFRWWGFEADASTVTRFEVTARGRGRIGRTVSFDALDPFAIPEAVRPAIVTHLRLILARDHTLGHAAYVMDAMGYEVTYTAALGRVLADAAAGIMLRACVFAACDNVVVPTEKHVADAVRSLDLLVLSQASVGAVF